MKKKPKIIETVLVAAVVMLAAGLAAAVDTEDPGPVPQKWAGAFSGLRPDPRPEALTRDTHYFVSDELRHDVFMEPLTRNKGGIFVGLGTDQNYLMAGWCRPDVVIPLDFDQMIVDLHYVFRVIFLKAADNEEFLDMWSEDHEKEIRSLIRSAYPDEGFSRNVLRAYKRGRRFVERRLKRVKRSYARRGVKTFLDDRQQYLFVVSLFKNNRVFPVRGDLTASKTVKDLAKAAKDLGMTIRTLYLSNAEQYFKYRDQYRENMLALPFDDKSIVLRTAGTGDEDSVDGRYEYIVQSGKNFQAWIQYPKTFNLWTLVRASRKNRETGLSVIDSLPPEPEKKK